MGAEEEVIAILLWVVTIQQRPARLWRSTRLRWRPSLSFSPRL